MKLFASSILTLAAVYAAPICQAQEVPPSPPVEFQYMLEFKTANTNRQKCEAYYEYPTPFQCPSKQRIYLRQLIDWGGSGQQSSFVGDRGHVTTGSLIAHEERFLDRGTCAAGCTNWSGSNVVTDWNNTSGPSLTNYFQASLINCDQWDRTDLPQVLCQYCVWNTTNLSPTTQLITNYCYGGSDTNIITYFSGGGGGNSSYTCNSTSWLLYTLTDEYTTEQLLSPDGLNYPDGDWSSGTKTDPAYSAIWNYEKNASMQKMEYRFKVLAPANAHFEVVYYVHFLAAGSTNEIITTNTLKDVGTGSWAYYGPTEFSPPYAYSFDGFCTNTIGASRWLTLGCGSVNGSCAACSKSPGGFTVGNADYGFYTSVSLGGDSFGDGSGSLIVAAASPQTSLVTPAGLEYLGSLSNVERIRDSNGWLRQVKSGQLLANIVVNSGTSYTIQCFNLNQVGVKQNGVYTTSGSPFSTGTIAQGSSGNEILVTVVNGVTSTYDFAWSDTDQGWTLTSGSGLRRETQSWNASTLTRTRTIKNSSNQVVYQETQQFQNLGASWGNAMIQRVVGPSGPALTTQWAYYANAQTDGTNFGSIKMVIQPSGAWTTYQYDTSARLTKAVSQFLNAATSAPENQCRVVTYDYTPLVTNCSCVCRIEKLLGQEISRQYTLDYGSEQRTIQCQTPGTTDLGAPDNLVTINRNYYDGNFIGKTKSILNPDGTMQLYSYATNASQTTTTVLSGQPNSTATTILDGTQTVTEVGAAGEMHYRKVVDIASNKVVLWDNYLLRTSLT